MTVSHVTAVVNLDLPGPLISRHLYGQFAEHLGRCIYGGIWVGQDSPLPNINGLRTEIIDALRAIRVPNLRWPGGCFADEYHWRDGIGPQNQRPRMVNTHWGNVVEDNSFGTHEFMELCELLGADAYVNGNVGSGTVREMSDWIEYLTRDGDSPMAMLRRENGRDKPWRVPFFGIGNEAWGCGGSMSAEGYTELARQYSTFVRDHDGNRVTRIAAGANRDDLHWTEELMKGLGCITCGDRAPGPYQAISLHYYTELWQGGATSTWRNEERKSATRFGEVEWYQTMAQVREMDWLLTRHSTVMDRYDPDRRVGLVLDEWGTWWRVEDGTEPGFLFQQNTIRDALVASTHFDAFHRHAGRLKMANIAQTVNVLQSMILTEPDTGQVVLTPTYYVFEMNVDHQDAQSLAMHVKGNQPTRLVEGTELPLVSMSASRKDGSALFSLTNLDLEKSHSVELDLRGEQWDEPVGRVLTARAADAHNAFDAPGTVVPRPFHDFKRNGRGVSVEIPPHSYVTLAMKLGD